MTAVYERIVVVTRRTRLEELIARFNSRGQARFCLERAGGDFGQYEAEDGTYREALARLRALLDVGLRTQWVDRALVPTFLFGDKDLVVTAGQDGLVANVAKYAGGQPLVPVNPDPARIDGVLLPFAVADARRAVGALLEGRAHVREVTLAEARLADGQRLLAFNDLFVGVRSHTSARYRITWQGTTEPQSSSGLIVSTGAGSTGWLSSIFAMVRGVEAFAGRARGGAAPAASAPPASAQPAPAVAPVLGWEDPRLCFVVREPFVSRRSAASVVAGFIPAGASLRLESQTPSGGVIFSDGVEEDFLEFNAGAAVELRAAETRARLVVG